MKKPSAGWMCLGLLAGSLGGAVSPQTETSQDLPLTVGRSVVIDYAADIGRIATSNPDVVDAVAVSTREVLLHAKAQGMSTIIVWSKSGRRSAYSIVVEQNLEPIRKLLKATFPRESIQVQAARDSLSLTGVVASQALADRAAALMAPFAKAVVNNLQVAPAGPERQVLLRVRFAEVNRNLGSSFGVNLVSTGVANTPGSISTGQFSPPRTNDLSASIPGRIAGTTSTFSIADALNVFAFRPDLNLAGFVKALQSQGLLQILAEPNLVTTNGKEASFLVGGEFPVPIVQGGANAGAVTILFKEFGIRLTFKPEITEHKTIRMYVKPEVSTIDLTNSVSMSGFTIPALATRRMETTIELGQGQSFVIAGLIDDRVTENLSKIPGLAHIPILGVLFKSRQENRTKTELIVMVTPEITAPVSAAELQPITLPKELLAPQLNAPSTPAPALKKRGGKRQRRQ
jgi:pilus assembly protein CpaC